jgi:hypothetical protein
MANFRRRYLFDLFPVKLFIIHKWMCDPTGRLIIRRPAVTRPPAGRDSP